MNTVSKINEHVLINKNELEEVFPYCSKEIPLVKLKENDQNSDIFKIKNQFKIDPIFSGICRFDNSLPNYKKVDDDVNISKEIEQITDSNSNFQMNLQSSTNIKSFPSIDNKKICSENNIQRIKELIENIDKINLNHNEIDHSKVINTNLQDVDLNDVRSKFKYYSKITWLDTIYCEPKCNPIDSIINYINDRTFIDLVHGASINELFPFQQLFLAAFKNNSNLISISIPGSGKTLCSCIALSNYLIEQKISETVKVKVIIIVDCEEELKCFTEIFKYFYQYYKIKTLSVCAGFKSDLNTCQLLKNGQFHVLLSTCSSLNSVINEEIINSIDYVIIDNLDSCIKDSSTDLNKIIMSLLISRKDQVKFIASCSTFDHSINNLFNGLKYTLIIACPIEMSRFKRLSINTELCTNKKRDSIIVSHLKRILIQSNVIVHTSTAYDAERLYQLFNSDNIKSILVTEFMTTDSIREIRNSWIKAHVINTFKNYVLVVSDQSIVKLEIFNVHQSIHYDFPIKKSFYRLRLACMALILNEMDLSRDNNDSSDCLKPNLTIYITEETAIYLPNVLNLTILNNNTNEELNLLVKKAFQVRSKFASGYCNEYEMFGCCKKKEFCKNRHLDPDFTKISGSFHSGTLKGTVVSIQSASLFYVKINEIISQTIKEIVFKNNALTSFELPKVLEKMLENYKEPVSNSKSSLFLNDYCIYLDKNGYPFRAKILSDLNFDDNLAKIICLDTGVIITVPTLNLYLVDNLENFLSHPIQIHKVIFVGLRPCDNEKQWSPLATYSVSKNLIGVQIEARICAMTVDTVWVDQLIVKNFLTGIQIITVLFDLKNYLKNYGFGEPNDEHLKMIEDLKKIAANKDGSKTETINKTLELDDSEKINANSIHQDDEDTPNNKDDNSLSSSDETISSFLMITNDPQIFNNLKTNTQTFTWYTSDKIDFIYISSKINNYNFNSPIVCYINSNNIGFKLDCFGFFVELNQEIKSELSKLNYDIITQKLEITLYKKNKDNWNKLTKNKYSWLVFDFGRMYQEEEEEAKEEYAKNSIWKDINTTKESVSKSPIHVLLEEDLDKMGYKNGTSISASSKSNTTNSCDEENLEPLVDPDKDELVF